MHHVQQIFRPTPFGDIPILTQDSIIESIWSFGEKGKAPWANGLRFLPNGRLGGYDHPHEHSWALTDDTLNIYSSDGSLTWKFYFAGKKNNLAALVGYFCLDDSFQGIASLTEVEMAKNKTSSSVSYRAENAGLAAAGPAGKAAKKIAMLVIGSAAPRIIDRVSALFDEARFKFFLHVDAKIDLAGYMAHLSAPDRFTVIEDRVAVFWGGFSMVEAELSLIRRALADPEISHFVLLSDDTAPLRAPDTIYRALANVPDRMGSLRNGWREGWYYGFFYPDSTFSALRPMGLHEDRQVRPIDGKMIVRLEMLRARGKKTVPAVCFGRQWWALSRETLEAIMDYVDKDDHFVESFRFSLFPDETFFPTAYNICFPETNPIDVPTYADFADVPRHPNPWIYHTAAETLSANFEDRHLFIRKIAVDRPEIIDEIGAALSSQAEAIRLVIWDLDETFWSGTLTEGGITYLKKNHKIVIELAKRGIMSSICSKNDYEPVKRVLVEQGIWDYFIFPSINWESKGPRLRALIEAVQLRPATILFIDDNALNLNEALHFVPGLQVSDELIIPNLLKDPRFKGKNDSGLTRLNQYKLLETRNHEKAASGDNVSFLRGSDIKVTIEHDLESHLDRVVELINRTNQLNFTKARLPEDPEAARQHLRYLLNLYDIQAGLVHVRDRYGDYGFVGVYVIQTSESRSKFIHFCFSCRTLGMGVENWLYERLGRPELTVVGEVLTDLFNPQAPVDWINSDGTAGSEMQERLAGRILIRGGCAMSSTAHYLALNADEVAGEFNIVSDGKHIRLDHSVFLRQALEGISEAALNEIGKIGYMPDHFSTALSGQESGPGFDVCVFSFTNDARYALYRHPTLGIKIPFFEFYQNPAANLLELDLRTAGNFAEDPQMVQAVEALRAAGYVYEGVSIPDFKSNLEAILAFIPDDVTLFFLLDPETFEGEDGLTYTADHFVELNAAIRELTASRPKTYLLEVLDFVERPEERINADHFNRMVYFRVYQKIAAILRANNAAYIDDMQAFAVPS